MKRLVVVAVVVALVATAIAAVMPVYAKSDTGEDYGGRLRGIVYTAKLASVPFSVDVLDRGRATIWGNGKVIVDIKVANATEQTYVVLLEWGGPDAREVSRLGEITTNERGRAVQCYDLADLLPLPPGSGPLPEGSIIASPDVIIASGPQPAASLFIPAVENPFYTP